MLDRLLREKYETALFPEVTSTCRDIFASESAANPEMTRIGFDRLALALDESSVHDGDKTSAVSHTRVVCIMDESGRGKRRQVLFLSSWGYSSAGRAHRSQR